MSIGNLKTEGDLKRFGDQYWDRSTASVAPIVVALPGSPMDGARVIYRPSMGLAWPLVFDAEQHSADGYGWVVLGGPRLIHAEGANHSTSSTSYVALTNGPAVEIPHAGIWDITFECTIRINATAAGGYASYTVNGTASDNWCVNYFTGSATNFSTPGIKTSRHILTAAQTVACRYRVTASTGYFDFRRLIAKPVRLES